MIAPTFTAALRIAEAAALVALLMPAGAITRLCAALLCQPQRHPVPIAATAPSRSARIRAMRAAGATQAAIAASVGCSRSTVRRTLAA